MQSGDEVGRVGDKNTKPIPAPPRGAGTKYCPIPAPPPLRGRGGAAQKNGALGRLGPRF